MSESIDKYDIYFSEDETKEIMPFGTNKDLDLLVTTGTKDTKLELVKQKYGLDYLIHDKDPDIRIAVARQKYGLLTLADDPNAKVRKVITEYGYIEKLFFDKDLDVRVAMIQRYSNFCPYDIIEKLAQDPVYYIRYTLARSSIRGAGEWRGRERKSFSILFAAKITCPH